MILSPCLWILISTRLEFVSSPLLPVGWTCLKEDWHNLPVRLSELGHEVLVFDQRGLGESSLHDEVDGPYTLERLADDAASLIRHVYPNQKVHVIGYSSQAHKERAWRSVRCDGGGDDRHLSHSTHCHRAGCPLSLQWAAW